MAKLVGVVHTSHGQFTDLPPDKWDAVRNRRSYRSDVIFETVEEREQKASRAIAAIEVLRAKVKELEPDVLVIFGDDQYECFDFSNFPALWVYVGASFVGPKNENRGKPELYDTAPGHTGLAVHTLTTLISNGFDPAFSKTLPNEQAGMCHAIMRPLHFLDRYDIPTVPILVNGYYPPQLPATRCYAIGRAVRAAIDSYPEDIRVVAIGSGGLWHTPSRPDSYLDEDFDRTCLAYLEKGDVLGMAEFFDSYTPDPNDRSQQILGSDVNGMTDMPALSGPQMGTREICNWICAAAVADGRPAVIVDYIPMQTSPVGTAFAYTDDL